MPRWFAMLLLLLGSLPAVPALGQTSVDAAVDAAPIREVITRQMDAFRRDDGIEAFSSAAPGIRETFRTPERFMAMVKEGYAAVYRPAHVQFVDLTVEDGALVQRVHVVGADGDAYMAHYAMQQMPDGSWKISAVWVERLPDVAV